MLKKYFTAWWKALRPFSLSVALIPTIYGGLLGWDKGHFNWLIFCLVIGGGVFLQAGTNLANDYFEFKQGLVEDKANLKLSFSDRTPIEQFIFLSGLFCFASVIPLGIYFIQLRGITLLILGIIGIWGGYAYTGQPFVYKNKGLGPLLVFFLMGNLMVFGSYYMQTGQFSWLPWLASIPISILTSLLLISNELRDIKTDAEQKIKTMSVRLGEKNAIKIFKLLLIMTYLSQFILIKYDILSKLSLLTLITIPFSLYLLKLIRTNRELLVIKTAHFHMYYGLILILTKLLA